MLLIYSHKITPRVRYIFKHIFTRVLLISVDFTSKIEEFVAHNGPKLSYTKASLGNEFFIKSNDLLFEHDFLLNLNQVKLTKQDYCIAPNVYLPNGLTQNPHVLYIILLKMELF